MDRSSSGEQGGPAPSSSQAAPLFAAALRHHQAGQLREAEGLYRQVLQSHPRHVGSLHHLGIIALQTGNPQPAIDLIGRALALDERNAGCHFGMGCAVQALGCLGEAVTHFRRAIELKPDYAEAHGSLGNALSEAGQLEEAAIHCQRSVELNPGFAPGHVNYGCVLLAQEQWAAAAATFERALKLSPNLAEAHANLGDACYGLGQRQDAERHYRRALAIRPNFAEAHNKLGVVLAARGALAEAIEHFQAALRNLPRLIEASTNLAGVLLSAGKPNDALAVVRQALSIAEAPAITGLFAQCIRTVAELPDSAEMRTLMLRALSEPWARPNNLAAPTIRLLKRDTIIGEAASRVTAAWPRRLPAGEFGPDGWKALAQNRLLHGLLETAIVSDLEFERFLTAVRSALMLHERGGAPFAEDAGLLNLRVALAQQCFINEYVFALADDELAAAQTLRDEIVAAMASGSAIAEHQLAIVAAYFPLGALPEASRLLERRWSAAIERLLIQQVREPAEEMGLRGSVPALTTIDDPVSRAVQLQYEENPYPRWAKLHPAAPALGIDRHLRSIFPAATFQAMGKDHLDILIAGCGTGQFAIETAVRFPRSRVLAVDLSRASLAYAMRKAREAKVQNIDFRQADIVQLGELGQTFDRIDASGVLHHLGDPLAGWRILLSLLRPGGFMEIGLYSEIARADVVEARAFIRERGFGTTAADIRTAREAIAGDSRPAFQRLGRWADFYSMSNCRDLLFHVQEHRFTIPQIAAFLSESGLHLLGFELDAATAGRYRARFPADPAMTDLACWDAFERDNPETFMGMYQFWVQKRGAARSAKG